MSPVQSDSSLRYQYGKPIVELRYLNLNHLAKSRRVIWGLKVQERLKLRLYLSSAHKWEQMRIQNLIEGHHQEP